MEWKTETGREIWLECRHDVWVRWSTVVRMEVVEAGGEFAVVLVTDVGTGEGRYRWKDAPTREEGRRLMQEELFRWLKGPTL